MNSMLAQSTKGHSASSHNGGRLRQLVYGHVVVIQLVSQVAFLRGCQLNSLLGSTWSHPAGIQAGIACHLTDWRMVGQGCYLTKTWGQRLFS
jgi:hypothetical protein